MLLLGATVSLFGGRQMSGNNPEAQSTARLPEPDVYEQEYTFWPWGTLLDRVTEWVSQNAPRDCHIVDYMCGTGYLLNAIHTRRPDLSTEGWDISSSYISYGRLRYPQIGLHEGDALEAELVGAPRLVLCTAGIHHLTADEKKIFLEKVASELPNEGWFIVGEEVLSYFSSERERREKVIELHTALMQFSILHDAPVPVIEAACNVLANDMLQRGEFKISLHILKELLATYFCIEDVKMIWPATMDLVFGDSVLVCKRRLSI
jgi:hypothetical protein